MTVKGRGGGGPPSKLEALDPAVVAEALALAAHAPPANAPKTNVRIAEHLGIRREALDDWLAKGRAGHPTFAAFARDFDRARAAVKDALLLRVLTGDKPTQAGAQWTLEKLFPLEFGRGQLDALTRKKMRAEIAALAQAKDEPGEVRVVVAYEDGAAAVAPDGAPARDRDGA